jgi:hypothetical protein
MFASQLVSAPVCRPPPEASWEDGPAIPQGAYPGHCRFHILDACASTCSTRAGDGTQDWHRTRQAKSFHPELQARYSRRDKHGVSLMKILLRWCCVPRYTTPIKAEVRPPRKQLGGRLKSELKSRTASSSRNGTLSSHLSALFQIAILFCAAIKAAFSAGSSC